MTMQKAGASLIGLCLVTLWQLPAFGQTTYNVDVDFQADDQSMWEPGDAGILDINYFIGPSWGDTCTSDPDGCNVDNFNRDDPVGGTVGGITEVSTPEVTLVPEVCAWGVCTPAVTIPAAELGDYGGTVTGFTAGQVGFDLNINADSGSVDIDYPGSVEFEWPASDDFDGDTFEITTSFMEGATAMSTNFPEASLTVDFILDVLAGGGFTACLATCDSLNFPTLDVDESLNLLTIDSNTLEVEFGVGPLTVAGQLPDLDTSTTGTNAAGNLVSSGTGADPLLDVDIDLDLIATTLLGLPPLGADVGIFGASAYYDLLNVLVGADVDVRQEFTFDPNLLVSLAADDGQVVSGAVGDSLEFNTFATGDTLVTPTFSLWNTFTNTTFLDITPTFLIAALEAGLILDLPGIVNNLGVSDISAILGPLFEFESEFEVLASIPIFSESWMIGFDQITAAGFTVRVPEPGTLGLLGLGLLVLGMAGRRRRQSPLQG